MPTLPGRLIASGCRWCRPDLYDDTDGRQHEGHFSIGLGDYMAEVTIDGEKAVGVREVNIDPATHLATVWVYPTPPLHCRCVMQSPLLEVWRDVPGVSVRMIVKAG